MLKCKDVSQLVSRSLDSKLSLRECFGLKLHLLICRNCLRFSQQLQKLNVTIANMKKNVENDTNTKLELKVKDKIIRSLETKN